MVFHSGMLYATSEAGEGVIAYKLPGQKITLMAGLHLARGFFSAMSPKSLIRFMRIMSKGGSGLGKKLDREKKPYIYVGMVCVREPCIPRRKRISKGMQGGARGYRPPIKAGDRRMKERSRMTALSA